MVSLKERTVKGRKYFYLSTTASYKGRKKWLEKMIGPKGMSKEEKERKVEFYSEILELKKTIIELVLRTKYSELQYLPKGYAFFLNAISLQYDKYLSQLYPSELEKYQEEFDVRYVNSTNALEGNTLTLRETGLVFTEGISPVNKKLREIHEVENYKRVLRLVRERKKDIDKKFILDIHENILRNIDDDCAGCYRRGNVKISGSKWEPPQGVVVEEEMEILLDWYHENKKKLDALELAGIFHHKFASIHPFADGNGRVGRELLNFILRRGGYPMLIVPVEERQRYLEGLEQADFGNPAPLLELFANLLIRDYFSVVFSHILGPGGELSVEIENVSEEETEELMDTLGWCQMQIMELMMSGGVDMPAELKGIVLSSFTGNSD